MCGMCETCLLGETRDFKHETASLDSEGETKMDEEASPFCFQRSRLFFASYLCQAIYFFDR